MAQAMLKLSGFKELKDMLSPGRFPARFRKHVAQATKKNALVAEGAVKRAISAGQFQANSDMTIAIKGSSKPLVGTTGELFKSIMGKARFWDTVLVGVHKSKLVRDSSGKTVDVLEIARLLHNGATIPVTAKMRRFFFMMAEKEPDKWKPLRARTKVIIIPPRRFLDAATAQRWLDVYQANWAAAVQSAMTAGRR